ncbi:hypothetical protein BT96DRAFT_1025387 [Gymnopus androsaceus JB14]|uniref:Uncharacterized protein n=1 Tax=Gymnopus androsaceus JB14 TaxID=1447944 RepID=A0A6A4GS25_9AGAR|nr:hypothetical protein BT96DRAFT_1025387 [Gymnopus androsaceus JB14]
MGNVASISFNKYRFLGEVITQSTRIDSRHLEHFTYAFWNGELANLILNGDLHSTLLGPQFPIWVSPKEERARILDPDTSWVSGASEPDGEARGVYVDFALVMPIVQPRSLKVLGKLMKKVQGKNLRDVLADILPKEFDIVGPQCFWVSGFEAPVLVELKPGPPRHPKDAQSYLSALETILDEAEAQVEEQALCLFCSWRFATQNKVVLIAGAGWYYRIKVVTREWAVKKLDGCPYTTVRLKTMKRGQDEKNEDEVDEHEDLGEDSECENEEKEEELYGDPVNAAQRQQQINEERMRRHERYNESRRKYLATVSKKPNYTDRSAPLFPAADLDRIYATLPFVQKAPKAFFEHGSVASFFVDDSIASHWSQTFVLGEEKSNEVMKQVKVFMKTMEAREDTRRSSVHFE